MTPAEIRQMPTFDLQTLRDIIRVNIMREGFDIPAAQLRQLDDIEAELLRRTKVKGLVMGTVVGIGIGVVAGFFGFFGRNFGLAR